MIIIGVDCATKPGKTGLALGSFENGHLIVINAKVGSKHELPEAIIADWLPKEQPVVLAFDAPLGWPTALAKGLVSHNAGELLSGDSNDLFRRETDRVVKAKVDKQPLDVGADRIARTAHSALKLINKLRETTGLAIPLAWEMSGINETCAIEAYPAATLKVHDISTENYKNKSSAVLRSKILDSLSNFMEIGSSRGVLVSDANALDAVICLLAASDFLQGKCIQPDDMALAKKEGWIWVRNPKLQS